MLTDFSLAIVEKGNSEKTKKINGKMTIGVWLEVGWRLC
jgi:hypothetical protein